MTNENRLGLFLVARRAEENLSQRQLAKLVKVTPAFLCDIEKGRRKPSLKTLARLSTALNKHPAQLELILLEEEKNEILGRLKEIEDETLQKRKELEL